MLKQPQVDTVEIELRFSGGIKPTNPCGPGMECSSTMCQGEHKGRIAAALLSDGFRRNDDDTVMRTFLKTNHLIGGCNFFQEAQTSTRNLGCMWSAILKTQLLGYDSFDFLCYTVGRQYFTGISMQGI